MMQGRKHAAQQSKLVKLTNDVVVADGVCGEKSSPTVNFEGRLYKYFRGPAGRSVYIGVRASELTPEDVKAINKMCDTTECRQNAKTKEVIARALSEHFNGCAFHINEIGCGNYPITTYLQPRTVSYHGIEVDPDCIVALKGRGLSISGWDDLPKSLVPHGSPTVAVAIYSMHFMLRGDFSNKIKKLISMDGFFVGNLYAPSANSDLASQAKYLSGLLKQANMTYIKLQCPSDSTQSYWIISKNPDASGLHEFANTLSRIIARCEGHTPRIVR